MKKSFTFFVLIFVLFAGCRNDDINEGKYFIRFDIIEEGSAAQTIFIQQESPERVSGNDIQNSPNISVGWGTKAIFDHPLDSNAEQGLYIHFAREFPKTDFSYEDGKYTFKNPDVFTQYFAGANLFNNGDFSGGSYIHENVLTYCSASTDEGFQNKFLITKTRSYIDEDGISALDVEGKFDMKYTSFCHPDDLLRITNGKFRLKILIDEIP